MKRIYLQKAKTQIARPNTIRDINKQIVLNYVRDRSPISRADIARETALQRSTVSSIIDDLHNADLIEEIGIGSSTGGRKPTLLKLKTGVPVAIGVDVTPRETNIAVADLSGTVLEKETFPTSSVAEFMSEQILQTVSGFADKYSNFDLEVGISVPGVTDQLVGIVRYVPYFQWRDWDIGKQIEVKLGLPVTIENDANAIALAELWFGREDIRKISNFITVLVAEGVGTGIVFDGQVYRGEKGAAGEFGHMIVGVDAPVECSCGSYDCWEAHASENAMIARYHRLVNRNVSFGSNIDVNQLVGLANQGEEHAINVLHETAKYLGIGISNLIVGLSPQAVVVSGRITKAWGLISDEMNSIIERSVRRGLPKTILFASSLGDHPTLIGSLSLVLAKKFASAS
jgi:predicted NBD/HSP70 family sugar kinase